MSEQTLEAEDFEDAIERFHRNGWTDGLPIVPPTAPRRLAQFCEAADHLPTDVIGFYELRHRPVTVEKVATNAIMAGCLPEHLNTVIAIVECMLDPDFGDLHTANSSTGSLALGFIVNGPIRLALGMNSHGNVLGPGNRANASIGRAIRLIQINVMGSVSGAGRHPSPRAHRAVDRSTMGRPEKYSTYHIAENEGGLSGPEAEFHVQACGYAPADNVVTVFNVAGYALRKRPCRDHARGLDRHHGALSGRHGAADAERNRGTAAAAGAGPDVRRRRLVEGGHLPRHL